MSSSLAEQLAARNTLDSSRLATAQSLKHPPSFIYTPRHAASVSTADLAVIASNAWDQLSAIDPVFERYQSKIFGEEARQTDRSSLSKEENVKLGLVLEKVMRAMGPYMLLKPAGIVLEWLIRRFRVNDLNIPALVALFLPYHTTTHFPSALNLIPTTSLSSSYLSCLIPAQKSGAPVPIASIVALFPPFGPVSTARPFLDFILTLPIAYLEVGEKVHRALVGFWLQILAGYLDRAGATLPDGERAAFLSTLLEVTRLGNDQQDILIAAYIILARFCIHNPLNVEALRVVSKSLVSNRAIGLIESQETDLAVLTTLVIVSQLAEGEYEQKAGYKFLGKGAWKQLLRMRNIGADLVRLSNQYNTERFMKPFLATLATEAITSDVAHQCLQSLLMPAEDHQDNLSPHFLATPVVRLVITSSLDAVLANGISNETTRLCRILNVVYQRWPKLWQAETQSRLVAISPNDSERLLTVMDSVLSGIHVSGGDVSSSSSSIALSCASPILGVRVSALKKIIGSADDSAHFDDKFLHEILLSRLAEPEAELLQILLHPDSLPLLHRVLSGEEILRILIETAKSQRANQDISTLIMSYVSGPLLDVHPTGSEEVLHHFFWPKLLRTKKNAAECSIAWKILTSSKLSSSIGWLKDLSSPFGNDLNLDPDNETIADQIAKNIASSPTVISKQGIDFILKSVEEQDVGSSLSTMVASNLCTYLRSSERPLFIKRVLKALDISRVGLDAFVKHSQSNTTSMLKITLLKSAVESLPANQSTTWSWLLSEASAEVLAHQDVVREIYQLAHSANSGEALMLSKVLLRTFFSQIVPLDHLAFLASIWVNAAQSFDIRVIALQDATAFFAAQNQNTGAVKFDVDYQNVVAAVLIALADRNKSLRVAGLKLLESINLVIPVGATANVFGKGTFYGPKSSGQIKYLDVKDLRNYLQKLSAGAIEITMDGTYLTSLHEHLLDAGEPEPKKKKATLSYKVGIFILSHVEAWKHVVARTSLLEIVSGMNDVGKCSAVAKILGQVLEASGREYTEVPEKDAAEVLGAYARLLLQPYQQTSRKWVEKMGAEYFSTFLQVLNLPGQNILELFMLRQAFAITRSTLMTTLSKDDRLSLYRRIVQLATRPDPSIASEVLACVRGCKIDNATLITYMNELRLSIASPVSKGAKRSRSSLGSSSGRSERIPELVILLESVDFRAVQAEHSLLLSLFSTLSAVVELSTILHIDVQYLGQLIIGALSIMAEDTFFKSDSIGESIHLSPVLDFMRSSVNPQTSQQALLLLAQLGPLVPDQLVHSVMPIFTFMGTNMLQRDDAYSLRVVDRTLESIVPALVTSKKQSCRSVDALVSELKGLLEVFTDAAAHVPRHRRPKLFFGFVGNLGAPEFLSAVLMLLIHKSVNSSESHTLPLAILEQFSPNIQIIALKQIALEISRLQSSGLQGTEEAFLTPADRSDESSRLHALSLQMIDLLKFIATSLQTRQLLGAIDAAQQTSAQAMEVDLEQDENLSSLLLDLVISLVEIHLSEDKERFTVKDRASLAVASQGTIDSVIRLMPTKALGDCILHLLDRSSADERMISLGFLQKKLTTIKSNRRHELSPAVLRALGCVGEFLRTAPESQEIEEALSALDSIVDSVDQGDDATLVSLVPDLIAVGGSTTRNQSSKMFAVSILRKLTTRLGPRLIPLASSLVNFAVAVVSAEGTELVAGAFLILEGLLTSIPTFLSSQLDKIFQVAVSSTASNPSVVKARGQMLTTASKNVSAKTLYPAIVRLFAAINQTTKGPILASVDLLHRSLRHGQTPGITDNSRAIFKLFLTIFDLRTHHSGSMQTKDVCDVEDATLGAFIQFVLKLNEQVFRPMFLRTYDWAVLDLSDEANALEQLTARKTLLYKLVDRLLTQLKSIMVPYYSFMLDQTIDLLNAYATGSQRDLSLWSAVTSATTKAIDFDETGFWTPFRLKKLMEPVSSQLSASFNLPAHLVVSDFHPLLTGLAQALTPHEELLKSLNLSILMQTRSDSLKVKRLSLEALEAIWVVLGDGMLSFVPETTPFLAETMEETEGGVEMVTRRLVKKIEQHLGESLQSYLET